MIEKLVLLMVLACPLMMGVMMLLMRRGMRDHHDHQERQEPGVRPGSNAETRRS